MSDVQPPKIVDTLPPKQIAVIRGGVVQSRTGTVSISLTKVVTCIGALSFGKPRSMAELASDYGFSSAKKVRDGLEGVAADLAKIGLVIAFDGDTAAMKAA